MLACNKTAESKPPLKATAKRVGCFVVTFLVSLGLLIFVGVFKFAIAH